MILEVMITLRLIGVCLQGPPFRVRRSSVCLSTITQSNEMCNPLFSFNNWNYLQLPETAEMRPTTPSYKVAIFLINCFTFETWLSSNTCNLLALSSISGTLILSLHFRWSIGLIKNAHPRMMTLPYSSCLLPNNGGHLLNSVNAPCSSVVLAQWLFFCLSITLLTKRNVWWSIFGALLILICIVFTRNQLQQMASTLQLWSASINTSQTFLLSIYLQKAVVASAKGRQSSWHGMKIHSTALRVPFHLNPGLLFYEMCGVVKPLIKCYSFPYEIYYLLITCLYFHQQVNSLTSGRSPVSKKNYL